MENNPEERIVSNYSSRIEGETSFAQRLEQLMEKQSVSAFARKVGLSESLLRKYLKGSEPSLAKANQIAQRANCSLEWLATGCGYQYRKAEVVDMAALELAIEITLASLDEAELSVNNHKLMKLIIANYQYLRSTKKQDGYLDKGAARLFAAHVASLC